MLASILCNFSVPRGNLASVPFPLPYPQANKRKNLNATIFHRFTYYNNINILLRLNFINCNLNCGNDLY